jgi:hypothetical protein
MSTCDILYFSPLNNSYWGADKGQFNSKYNLKLTSAKLIVIVINVADTNEEIQPSIIS